jgi:pilus assembly protein CpaC
MNGLARPGFGRRIFSLFVATLLAVMPVVASAAPQIVSPNGAPLVLDVSKGIIMRLDRAAANVFVADPAIADVNLKSPTTIYIVGKAAGVTTIFAVDQEDRVLLNSRVEVKHDAAALQRALNQMVPGNQVEVKPVEDSIVLSGEVKSPTQGDDISRIAARFVPDKGRIINNTEMDAPNQVNLRVRIAEVSRNVVKEFGINWQNAFNNGTFAFGLVTAGSALVSQANATSNVIPLIPRSAAAGSANAIGFNTQATGLSGTTVGNLYGGLTQKTFSLDSLINALDTQGLITVLAEPNLTAVSGQKASFLAGGEFPVPVPQASSGGSPVITVEYKQFGVSLNFTPTVLGHGRIALHVEPEVSQISTQNSVQIDGFNIPSLTTRRAETTVELGSGQSFIIGGLLQNGTTQDLTKFPWLGDVPILGALFRSTAFQRNESELVIIVTPYLVKPDSDKRLTTPLDGFVAPNDSDRLMRGALNKLQADPNPTAMLSSGTPTPLLASPAPAATTTTTATKTSAPAVLPGPGAAAPPPAKAPVGPFGFEID